MTAATPLKTGQVLERLGIHRNTLRKLVLAGTFPQAFQVGKSWRFPPSDIDAYIAARQRAAPRHNAC